MTAPSDDKDVERGGSGNASGKYAFTTTVGGWFVMAGNGAGWAYGEGSRCGNYGYGDTTDDGQGRTTGYGSGFSDGWGLPDGTGRG